MSDKFPSQEGLNSNYIGNGLWLSPAKISVQEHQGVVPYSIPFNVVGREGQFTDATIANYATRANSVIGRFLLNEVSKRLPYFFKGELTTQYEGVTPKDISFDIIFRADKDLTPSQIITRVKMLQSLCYPRGFIGLNPPLCNLHILNLYSLEVYVKQVLVTWHNQWDVRRSGKDEDFGLPMGCDISMTVMMHQYPTREEVLAGAGFDSTNFMGNGYSGTFQDNNFILTHANKTVQAILNADRAYAQNDKVFADELKAQNQAKRQFAENKQGKQTKTQ